MGNKRARGQEEQSTMAAPEEAGLDPGARSSNEEKDERKRERESEQEERAPRRRMERTKRGREETGDKESKIQRTEGEAQGGIERRMDVDSVDEIEWQEMKDELQEKKMPFLVIEGMNQKRAIQASKIQDLMGEYYIWETPKKGQTLDLIKKMNYIGGEGVVVGDTKVWTNSE